MFFVNLLLIVAAVVIAIPAAMFCLEVLLAIVFGSRRTKSNGETTPHTFAVLIPAHNEQAVIQKTLQTLLPTIPAGNRQQQPRREGPPMRGNGDRTF